MPTVVSVQQGGTGANNLTDARAALGVPPVASYDQANNAYLQANNAYTEANLKLNLTGGTITGNLVVSGNANANNLAVTNRIDSKTVSLSGTGLAVDASQGNILTNQVTGTQFNFLSGLYTATITGGGSVTSDYTLRLPANTGSDGQVLTSNGTGFTFWTDGGVGNAFNQANAAYTQANSAFTSANNSNLKSGGVITGTLNVTNDIIVGGNVYLQGNTTYINVATYQINDSLMYVAANNTLTDSVDIGFVGAKNTSGTFSHTGLARDATDGKYKLFDNLPDSGHVGNVIDFANTSLATLVANVEANNITIGGNLVATQANLTLAHNQANSAYGQANNAYGAANNRVLKAGDTMTGELKLLGSVVSLNVANVGYFSGNVGIGTTSPTYLLEMQGSAPRATIRGTNNNSNVGYRLEAKDSGGTNRSAGYYFQPGTGSTSYLGLSADDSGYQLIVMADGNVGIGTTSPQGKLHVYGGDTVLYSGSFGNSPKLIFGGEYSDTDKSIYLDAYWLTFKGHNNEGFKFITANSTGSITERFRVSGSGETILGPVATTTADGMFTIKQYGAAYIAISFRDYNNARSAIYIPDGYYGYQWSQRIYGNGGKAFAFAESTGTTEVGNIVVNSGSVAYNTTSDYRLKENQAPLTGSGAFIDALQPKTWTWKSNGERGVGLIAHEVAAVSPSSVTGEKDATRLDLVKGEDGNYTEQTIPSYQALDYGSSEFIANIIAELQSLRARVADLENK